VAQELTLSFVPEPERRLWRTLMRRKYQLTRNRVQAHNRLEAHLKLSSLVSDLLGLSARRMLQAVADGETEPARLAGWIPHSRSSPKSGRALSRFRRPSTSRRGWAFAPASTKAPA
jgi:transposase